MSLPDKKNQMNKQTVDEMLAEANRLEQLRAAMMPTEKEALMVMFQAYQRLRELGFRDSIYCPKDGSDFEIIEAGCTSVGLGMYQGEWPKGRYWSYGHGDLWPSKPILFRPIKADQK